LRTNRVRTDTQTHRHTDRHTPMTTRPCGLRRAGNQFSRINGNYRKSSLTATHISWKGIYDLAIISSSVEDGDHYVQVLMISRHHKASSLHCDLFSALSKTLQTYLCSRIGLITASNEVQKSAQRYANTARWPY